jgi:hypothetical protein
VTATTGGLWSRPSRARISRGPVPVDGLGRAVHEDRDVRPLGGHLDRVGAVGDDVGRDAEVLEQPARGELADGRHRRGRGHRRRRFGVVHGQETVTVERDHTIR